MSCTILIVDQSQENKAIIRNFLNNLKIFIREAESTVFAEEILKQEQIDILLVNDIVSPQNSLDFIKTIKGRYPYMKIFVISSKFISKLKLIGYFESGVLDFINTKEDLHALKARINSIIVEKNCIQNSTNFADQKALERAKYDQKITLMREVSTNIANELKDPFNFILNFTNILLDKKDPSISEESREILGKIKKYAQIAHKTLDFMIDHTSIKSGVLEKINIHNLLESAILNVDAKFKYIKSCKISVIRNFQDKNFNLTVDRCNFLRAVENILENAYEAINDHNDLHFKGVINVVTYVDDGKFFIKISDNGVSIPQNIINKIFDPFFSTKANSNGMGLAIAKQVIEKMNNGSITTKSDPETGTEFTISVNAK